VTLPTPAQGASAGRPAPRPQADDVRLASACVRLSELAAELTAQLKRDDASSVHGASPSALALLLLLNLTEAAAALSELAVKEGRRPAAGGPPLARARTLRAAIAAALAIDPGGENAAVADGEPDVSGEAFFTALRDTLDELQASLGALTAAGAAPGAIASRLAARLRRLERAATREQAPAASA